MADRELLKEQAISYYHENNVPLRMQDVLNVMFKANPQDVNGYVSTFFEELSLVPTITRVLAVKSMDNKGQPSIRTKIYCLVRNKEILVAESNVCVDTMLMDNAKVEDTEAEDVSRAKEIDDAVNFINNDFLDTLTSANPRHQKELDTKVYKMIEDQRLAAKQLDDENRETDVATPQAQAEDNKKGAKKSGKGSGKKKNAQVTIIPDKPREKLYPGSTSVTALSQALCKAGASLAQTPLFDHLISSYGGDDFSIALPLPVITLAQSGKAASGKSNCIKEYMIVPRQDMPISKAITSAIQFHDSMTKSLFAKNGVTVKYLNDFGALCPVFDKPEQGLDMIADVVSQQGFEMGTDFFFILNASANEFFDYEKGKYEVITGMAKASDDMADFWADLSNRYPAIIGIINPVRCEEKEQWNKVCSRISDHCLIIGDNVYDRPGLLKDHDLNFTEFGTSGTVLRLEGCNTITHIIECAKKMTDMNNTIMLAGGQHETNDTTVIDVAIACQARFVKLGAPARGERIAKFNRLFELDSELAERKAEQKPLQFPVVPPKLPTPTPESEEGAADE